MFRNVVNVRMLLKSGLFLIAMLSLGLAPIDGVQAAEIKKTKSIQHKGKVAASVRKTTIHTGKAKSQKVASRKVVVPVSPTRSRVLQETGPLVVQSGAALVVDQSGDALYQKNAGVVTPIASITKLMTAMVVLDSSPNLQAPITITEEDVDYLRGSRSRLSVGSVLSRESALLLALMSSENRAAHALARNYPGGLSAMLSAMNVKAQSLGMRDTHFEDPTGLNSNNVSTANDLAKMVAAAYRYPLIREFTTTPEAVVDIGRRELAFHNTNPLVKSADWEVGLSKTGFINEAGKCLVMQARVADKPLFIVLLDSVGRLTRVGDANRIRRWLESAQASRRMPTHASLTAPSDGTRPPG